MVLLERRCGEARPQAERDAEPMGQQHARTRASSKVAGSALQECCGWAGSFEDRTSAQVPSRADAGKRPFSIKKAVV